MNPDIKEKIDKVLRVKENLLKDIVWLRKGKTKKKKGVYLGKKVKIEPNVFFDTSEGEIVIGDKTKIKANAVLRGPLYIGIGSTINSFAEISCSRIGDHSKVGGEVDHVFFNDYSNKQHYGYLGWSYVGFWVNIGGGTSIATLKNTYSNVKVGDIDTGSQFFGAILGDYVKTAINTSIFCGKVIGPSAHLYGTVVEDVPAFTSHVAPGKMYELPLEIAIKAQTAMASRRNVKFTATDQKNFEKLFRDTEPDRKSVGVLKQKLSFK